MHDPDLIIRTSGEQRISNYLIWQAAYSELVFRDELWPDFSREAFEAEPGGVRRPQAALRGALAMPQGRRRSNPEYVAFAVRAAAAPRRVSARRADDRTCWRGSSSRSRRRSWRSCSSTSAGWRSRVLHDRDRVGVPARALPDARAVAAGAGGRLRVARGDGARRALRHRSGSCWRWRWPRCRCSFLFVIARRSPAAPPSRWPARCSASTGSASPSRTPCCCASSRTATGSSSTSWSGTFLGDTAAYIGGRLFGRRPLAPADLAEQDRRGAVLRGARRDPGGLLRGAVSDLAAPRATRCCSASRSRCWRRSATCSSRWSSATRAQGRGHAVRRPRRRARPPRRGDVHDRRRLLHLGRRDPLMAWPTGPARQEWARARDLQSSRAAPAGDPRLHRLDRRPGARRGRARATASWRSSASAPAPHGSHCSRRRAGTESGGSRWPTPTPPRGRPRRGPTARCWAARTGWSGWSPRPSATWCSTRSSARPGWCRRSRRSARGSIWRSPTRSRWSSAASS